MRASTGAPSPAVRAFVRWTLRQRTRSSGSSRCSPRSPRPCARRSLYLHLRSEVEQLLPREAPSVRALDEMRARSPGLQFLGVVAEVPDAGELPAAERFLDDLAGAHPRLPARHGARRPLRATPPRRPSSKKHAPLYTRPRRPPEIRRRIEARRDYEVAKETGHAPRRGRAAPLRSTSRDIEKQVRATTSPSEKRRSHRASTELRAAMLTVEAGGFTTGRRQGPRAARAREGRRRGARTRARTRRGMRVGYASDVAINVEELDALEAGPLGRLGPRRLRRHGRDRRLLPLVEERAGAHPAAPAGDRVRVRASRRSRRCASPSSTRTPRSSARSSSATGSTSGLVLLARYREERRAGRVGRRRARRRGVWGARARDARGGRRGGRLVRVARRDRVPGLPAVRVHRRHRDARLVGARRSCSSRRSSKWLDTRPRPTRRARRARAIDAPSSSHRRAQGRASSWRRGARRGVGLRGARFDSSRLEYDFNKLRRADTWKNGEGYWGRKMDAILGHYLTPTVILCDDARSGRAVAGACASRSSTGPSGPWSPGSSHADDVLPPDQEAKIAEVEQHPRGAHAQDPIARRRRTERDKLDRMLGDERPRAHRRSSDLPAAFTTGHARARRHDRPHDARLPAALRRALEGRRACTCSSGRCATSARSSRPRARCGWPGRSPCRATSCVRSAATRPVASAGVVRSASSPSCSSSCGPAGRAATSSGRSLRRRALAGGRDDGARHQDQLRQLHRLPDHLRHRRRLRRERHDPLRPGRRARRARRRASTGARWRSAR